MSKSVSQFLMIQECKGIFCIVFLFHKALYLWLCILAVSTLPPTSHWPLSLCNQRRKIGIDCKQHNWWKLQVKYLWVYSHLPWFNSINYLTWERLTLILFFHARPEMTKDLKWLYEAGKCSIIYKVLMLWQKIWTDTVQIDCSLCSTPCLEQDCLVYFYCVILILTVSVHCYCKRKT